MLCLLCGIVVKNSPRSTTAGVRLPLRDSSIIRPGAILKYFNHLISEVRVGFGLVLGLII